MSRTLRGCLGSMFRLSWMSRHSKAMALQRALQAVVDEAATAGVQVCLRWLTLRGVLDRRAAAAEAAQRVQQGVAGGAEAGEGQQATAIAAGPMGQGGPRFMLSATQQSRVMRVLAFSFGVLEERLPWNRRSPWTKLGDALICAFRFILAMVLTVPLVNPIINPFFS